MSKRPSPLRAGGKPPAPVLNIAHRGARAFAPENTLEAFEKAGHFGCPMFEMDVHLSQDGELIVVHDDTLLRCSDVKMKFPSRPSYFVSDFTAAEIRRLDAGRWYVEELERPPRKRQPFLQTLSNAEVKQFVSVRDRAHYASGKVVLPTLAETLQLAQRLEILVNVEIKTLPRMYPGIAEKVVRLVESMKMERRVILSSFDHVQLIEVRRLSRVIATGALTSDRIARPGDYVRKLLDADAYNPGAYGDYDSLGFNSVTGRLDPVSIRDARDAGLGVNAWTVNEPAHMRALIDAGVTGIISDYANRVRDVLGR
jgi:glycerophosphoryl diester phosphodiesterase